MMFHYLFREYKWVHLSLGLVGNICFIIGSVLFLFETHQTIGVYFFIAGSSGMLIGNLGQAFVSYEAHRGRRQG